MTGSPDELGFDPVGGGLGLLTGARLRQHGGIGLDVDYSLHRHFTWAIQIEHDLGSARHQPDTRGRMIAAHGLPPA